MNFTLLYFRAGVSALCILSILFLGQTGFVFFGLFIGELFLYKKNKKQLDEREKELSLKSTKLAFISIILFVMTILQLTNFEITNYSVEEIIFLMASSIYFFTSMSLIYIFKKNAA